MTEEEKFIQYYNAILEYEKAFKILSKALKLENINLLENLTPKTYKSFSFDNIITPEENNTFNFIKANNEILEEFLPKIIEIIKDLQGITFTLESYKKTNPLT